MGTPLVLQPQMGPNADIYKFGNCKLTIDRGKLKFLGETAVTVCLCRT